MVKRIIIHVGDSKTGSTSLQLALRKASDGVRLFYPSDALNHNALARSLSRPRLAHMAEPRFREIWQEIEASSANTAVLSAELFQAVRPRDLMQAIQRYWPSSLPDISIIVYCRAHVPRLVAMYSERIKFGRDVGSLDDYAAVISARKKLDYAPRFAAWMQLFGSAFQVRLYPAGSDTVADFFAQVLPESAPPKDVPRANPSLTVTQVALLQRVPDLVRAEHDGVSPPSVVHRLICQKLRVAKIGSEAPLPQASVATHYNLQRRYRQDALEMDELVGTSAFQNALRNIPSVTAQKTELTSPQVDWFDTMVRKILVDFKSDPERQTEAALRELRQALV